MARNLIVSLVAALGLWGLAACGDGRDRGTSPAKSPVRPAAAVDPNAKPYPLDVCVVSGQKLGSMGEPMKFAYKGQEIKLCCQGCFRTTGHPERFSAKVLYYDNAGNLISLIGNYGNFDSQYVNPATKKPSVATPEIPLAWPSGAGFTENSIYLCDTYNRRAVRVDKAFKAEASCGIP
jgi:hypothetical protein